MLGSEWICSGCLFAYLISVAYFRAFVPGFVSVLWLLPAYLRLEAFILSYAVNLAFSLSCHLCFLKGHFTLVSIYLKEIIKNCKCVPEQPILAGNSQQHLSVCVTTCVFHHVNVASCCMHTHTHAHTRCAYLSLPIPAVSSHALRCLWIWEPVSSAQVISHVALVNKSLLWGTGRLTDSILPPQ